MDKDYIHNSELDESTYPFPKFSSAMIKVWQWMSNFIHTLLGMWLCIHADIQVNPCQ